MPESVRLSKRLIELIQCSRKDAETYIEGGWVLVDGEVVDLPQFDIVDQKVELRADATLDPIKPMTLLFNMSQQFESDSPLAALKMITPESRLKNDFTGIRTLKRHFSRLLPTLPLENGATGLMVFTQDRRIANRLLKSDNKNEQEYVVEVEGEIVGNGLKTLNAVMQQNGKAFPIAKVSWQNENKLRFVLKNVELGQIKTMCSEVGLTVVSMSRIRIGRIPLAKLPSGEWQYLPFKKMF